MMTMSKRLKTRVAAAKVNPAKFATQKQLRTAIRRAEKAVVVRDESLDDEIFHYNTGYRQCNHHEDEE